VMAIGVANVLMLAKSRIQPLDEKAASELHTQAHRVVSEQWAHDHGFTWDGAYQLNGVGATILIAAWQQTGSPTYLCIYFAAGKQMIDIVSIFSEHFSLTTTNSQDGQFFPPSPGSYAQSFANEGAPGLWRYHTEAETLVAPEDFTEAARIAERPFPDVVQQAVVRQMASVRARPAWFLMIPYWYFVRRRTMHNVSVRDQLMKSG